MSTQFKPLSEQIAGKMIADLTTGNSIFHRPGNSPNSALPFNLETGHRYAGPSALILLMQKRDDPRWATSNQANRNHTAVLKGSTGTLINFMSSYEYQGVVDGDNNPVLKENGKQRFERVKLEAPKQMNAWLFNGEQLRKMPKWEKEQPLLSPAEKAQVLLDNSKAIIEHGGEDMFYDERSDTIVLPEMEQFANPEQYYAEALHQLAHWTSAEGRLNRVSDLAIDPAATIREELRTNLTSLFLSKELNLPYALNAHEGYVNSWAELLKNDPAELFKAASDAQKIVDQVLGFEKEQEIEASQETGISQEADMSQEIDHAQEMPGDRVNYDHLKLHKGEIIPHNGTEFKVMAELKNNIYNMQDLGSKQKFKLTSRDELFNILIETRNYTQEMAVGITPANEYGESEYEQEENEQEETFEMTR